MAGRVRRLGYRWHLRRLMAERGMFATTDLLPLLAERGVQLSGVQVYRLVAQTPERLNLHVLAALCDILGCTPADLLEVTVQTKAAGTATAAGAPDPGPPPRGRTRRPTRARITPDTRESGR